MEITLCISIGLFLHRNSERIHEKNTRYYGRMWFKDGVDGSSDERLFASYLLKIVFSAEPQEFI